MFFRTLFLAAFILCTMADSDIETLFKDTLIIPDMIDEAPKEKLKVTFENGLVAGDAKECRPAETASVPRVDWPSADPEKYYAIYMGCPDAPYKNDPRWSEALHWLVVNVPGNQVDKGDIFCTYLGALPPKDSGILRFVFLVYEQPNKMQFDDNDIVADDDWKAHKNYKIRKFAEQYKLGSPIAGNVFLAQYDETVPGEHKRLGIDLSVQ